MNGRADGEPGGCRPRLSFGGPTERLAQVSEKFGGQGCEGKCADIDMWYAFKDGDSEDFDKLLGIFYYISQFLRG